jgi:hypothetical protein
MDPLEPGRLLVSMDRDSAPEVEAHGEGHIPAGQATVDQGNADRARCTDQSSVLAALSSLAANHNRSRRSAKLAGSLREAQHRPLEGLALECHTGKPQPAAAKLVRRDSTGRPLGLER